MATSVRLMVESCTCGAAVCTCASRPLNASGGPPQMVQASAYEDDLARARVGPKPMQAAPHDVNKVRHLLRAMQRGGVKPPTNGVRLSAAQLTSMLEGQSVSERISLRMLCDAANILPQDTR
jgi:hypothetical protein